MMKIFFFFEEFNNLNEDIKNELYNNLKQLYDKKEIKLYIKALEMMAEFRIKNHKKFETIYHEYNRFLEFKKNLNKIHNITLKDKNKKILVFSHSSFIKISTSPWTISGKNKKGSSKLSSR